MAKKASTAASPADAHDAPHGDACPNCDTPRSAFGTVKRMETTDSANAQRAQINERRAALDAERGVLQRCPGCGYQTRAHDVLEPAQA